MANIMVVDDDFVIRSLLKQVLTLHKHQVREATDGLDALGAIHQDTPPDLLLIDHQMPKLSGIDCAKRLKSLFPSLKIILISGSFKTDCDKDLSPHKHLFTDVLLKPFGIKEIVSSISSALGCNAGERHSNILQPG